MLFWKKIVPFVFALMVTSVAAGAIDLWRDAYLEWSGVDVMFLIYNYLMDPLPVKLVIVGDGAVGKTSLLFRCVLFYSATLRTSSPDSTSPPFSITTLPL